ncbi:hypothetical protein, partial [Escherichia coli]|uniref:hypothetical protein n=1 Tax=Escherichia coli TaxID=562 RepID=UPI001F4AA68A
LQARHRRQGQQRAEGGATEQGFVQAEPAPPPGAQARPLGQTDVATLGVQPRVGQLLVEVVPQVAVTVQRIWIPDGQWQV